MSQARPKARTEPVQSATFSKAVNAEIRRAAETGIYDIRGGGSKRRVPHFDDLLFLGASISRYPLEGYREKCATNVTLGTRFAKTPIELAIPITIAGMWGFVFQGAAYEGLTCNAQEWIASFGGGRIVENDGTIAINNPKAAEAINLAASWVGDIAPDGVLNYKEEDARGVFQSGNSVFMSVRAIAHHLEAGLKLPDRFDFDPDAPGNR